MGPDINEIVENYTITREKRAGAYGMINAHYHDHYEIYYLAKGNVRYFIGDRTLDLNEGDVVLIPPHVIHKTATLRNQGAERVLIAFTNKFIMYPKNNKIFACFEALHFKNPPIRELIENAEKEFIKNDMYSEELIAGYIREILIKLSRTVQNDGSGDNFGSNSIVQKALYYITQNYSQEISLTILSKNFGLSESYFSRQFKLYTGFGVNEYITTVRIKNAEKLLSTTNIPITKIAQNCGFNSSSYFACVFKKMRGISPGAVRKKWRNRA